MTTNSGVRGRPGSLALGLIARRTRSALGIASLLASTAALGCATTDGGDGVRLPDLPVAGSSSGGASGSSGGGPAFVEVPDASRTSIPDDCGGTCDGSVAEPACGDGLVNGDDECDDGNAAPGDGCSPLCVKAPDFACVEGQLCVSTVVCGDRRLSTGEGCDDGNTTVGDGCDAACQIELGWICPILGVRCNAAACGDGILAGLEQCDDGNPDGTDGCDTNCTVEEAFACVNSIGTSPPSVCHVTTCNDGTAEGSEACDDGNQIIGDGCSPLCDVEPTCPKTGGACSSSCGDGLILPTDMEECDDGNALNGDGCSTSCVVEPGYDCPLVEAELPPTRDVLFTFRDFVAIPSGTGTVPRHPDFNANCGDHVEGIAEPVLDTDGKPVNTALCDLPVTCTPVLVYSEDQSCDMDNDVCADDLPCKVADSDSVGSSTHGLHPIAGVPGDPFALWYRDNVAVNKTQVVTQTLTLDANEIYQFASDALYPFDGAGWVLDGAELEWDDDDGTPRNYGFTTEVRQWFQFQGGELLSFSGDDDVWIFVNGRLALDLGGVHQRLDRTIRLSEDRNAECKVGVAGTDAEFDALDDCDTPSREVGIEVGNVYEVALFHAERHVTQSNFSLGLGRFVSATTDCRPVCGDGIVTADEQCDNGEDNVDALEADDAYGGCTTACALGPYCGDGEENGDEDCDDGANVSAYGSVGCSPGCVTPPRCGDGVVQSDREECDLGDDANLGGYDGCEANCQLGPFCGDGDLEEDREKCDDGNRKPGDGCNAKCDNTLR